jgi:lipopolysaccharide transport system permease protein
VVELTVRDIKLRYKHSYLGILWSLLHSLAQIRIFRFLFGAVLASGVPNFTAFLFIGVLVWAWFRTALAQGVLAITHNRELVTQPGFPVVILPIISVTTSMVDFLLAAPILVLFLATGGNSVTSSWLLLPLVMIVQFIFMLGLVYILATIQVNFRDTTHFLSVLLSLGFFLTPVFFDVSRVPEKYQIIFQLNPLTYLLEGYRSILIYGQFPRILPLFIIGLLAVILLYTGYTIFLQAHKRFVDEI